MGQLKTFVELDTIVKTQAIRGLAGKMFELAVDPKMRVVMTMLSDMLLECIVQGFLARAAMRDAYRAGRKTGRVN
jgi:hypothetical protein